MPDSADPLPSQPPPGPSSAAARPDPDMPPRKPAAGGKLKKPLTGKQRAAAEQRLAHLRSHLHLRPLDARALALPPPYEAALRALGLLDFARLDLASAAPRPDLIAPLVAYYEPGCKRSFVRGVRVSVSRSDLARALCLPSKPAAAAEPPPDADPAMVTPAVMQLLHVYVLLPFQGDDMCILPQEVAAAEQAVREGSAHRVDWAGLIWGLVEKEMLELPNRKDGVCYYGQHLQRLIWAQKPKLFVAADEGDRGEAVPEACVDVEMDEEDGDADADVKSKSLEELEDADADADMRSKALDESELGNAHTRGNHLDELELGNADTRNKVLKESESGDVDVGSKIIDDVAVDEDARIKGFGESEAVDQDAGRNSLDESEAVDESTKGVMNLDESDNVDEHANGMNLYGFSLGFVAAEAVPATHDMMPADNEDAAEMALERGHDVAVAPEEEGNGPLVETLVVTQEVVVAVPEEVEDDEPEGEEERGATGLSLGISSTNGYDSMDVEEEPNAENLDEGDSGDEEAEESEDDAFEECKDEDDMNWRIGDEKGDGGMTHCLQRCSSSAFEGMQFENLNKGEVEMRNELRFDDFPERGSLERMTSANLLQAMNSIPSSYNVTESVHDLSSGEFLAMGTDPNKNGVDLGPGSSHLFGNNGKRHIGDIDGYSGNMQVQEQFLQQKRMHHSNSSGISSGSVVFNATISVPMQNLMFEASRLYAEKEQELQSLQFEKQEWANMMQEKEAMIQSLNSSRFEQHNKYQAELRRFEHDLNVMAQLVSSYKKALKQTRASFHEYRKKFPSNKPRYDDVPGGGGLILSVRELERKRLELERENLALANEMIRMFEQKWFSKLDEWMSSVHSLRSRMEELFKEVHLLRENRKARLEALATEE